MPIDPVLALLSDRLFMATVGVYVLALALHAVEYAGTRSQVPPAQVREGELARTALSRSETARAAPPRSAGSGDPGARGRRDRAERFGRMGVAVVLLGVLLHTASIATRGLAAGRWPLGNMYEFTAAICLAAVVVWLVVLYRGYRCGQSELRAVGVFVLFPVVVLLFLAGTVLYAQAAPVQPALQSYWLVIHVTTISLSSGMLLFAGVASLLYLLRRSGRGGALAARLPGADALDRIAYRITVVAFPIYTFAVITGAIWAEAAWGRFWGWDPKETVAFIAWVIYAAYLHARATAGWRTDGAAWINVAGFAAIAFNFFFINLVVAGLHSYAGV